MCVLSSMFHRRYRRDVISCHCELLMADLSSIVAGICGNWIPPPHPPLKGAELTGPWYVSLHTAVCHISSHR